MPTLYKTLIAPGSPRPTRKKEMVIKPTFAPSFLLPTETIPVKAGRSRRILIAGAGLAGLAAGYELSKLGHDVTILEARDRIGGRVCSIRDWVPGKNVEAGGELVGINHGLWLKYAKQFGLRFHDVVDSKDAPIIFKGKFLRGRQREKLGRELGKLTNYLSKLSRSVDPYKPWVSPDAADLDNKSLRQGIEDFKGATPDAKAALISQLEGDNGVSADQQSFLANLAMIHGGIIGGGTLESFWEYTENFRCRGGNAQLAEALADAIGRERIVLRAAITHVDSGKSPIEVIVKNDDLNKPPLHTCDDLVLTVPPRAWVQMKFHPSFPPGLSGDLAPQVGKNVKFVMALKGPFWTQDLVAPDSQANGPIDVTWDATEGQHGSGTAGAAWTAFSGSADAEKCRSWKPTKRFESYVSFLSRIYKGIRPSLLDGRFFDWSQDSWVQGSYAFPACGEVTRVGPIYDNGLGNIHFAGEHTCYAFMGYMEGALQSGATVAGKIQARIQVLDRSLGDGVRL